MLDFALAFLGLTILVLAGDALVRGSVNLSIRLGVPALIVSLTIVAVGTSAPELLIAVSAVIDKAPGIALGNIVGSNIANILLVLGFPALLAGIESSKHDTRMTYLQMIAGTGLFMIVAWFSPITWVTGLPLLLVFLGFMTLAVHAARCHRRDRALAAADATVEGVDPKMSWRIIALLVVAGLIGLPLGAELLVDSATAIARRFGMSETVIGLTLVAVGTSLPELATTISAAMRRQPDVALGNVIGSNMANILGIIGFATLFGPIPIPAEFFRFDVMIMAASSLLLAPFIFGFFNITRLWGLVFVGAYVIYVLVLLV